MDYKNNSYLPSKYVLFLIIVEKIINKVVKSGRKW